MIKIPELFIVYKVTYRRVVSVRDTRNAWRHEKKHCNFVLLIISFASYILSDWLCYSLLFTPHPCLPQLSNPSERSKDAWWHAGRGGMLAII